MYRYTTGLPSPGLRAKSALTTLGFALVCAMFAGLVISVGMLVLVEPQAMGELSPGGITNDVVVHGGLAHTHPLARVVAEVALCLVVALAASRLGAGAVGDAVFDIRATRADGSDLDRPRAFLNAALPIALWEALRFPTGSLAAVVVVAAVWLPALIRRDRRSLFSIATGTYYQVQVPLPDVERGWSGRSGSPGNDDDDWGGPTLIG